jgi:transglutaminase-like putative cysteine protease
VRIGGKSAGGGVKAADQLPRPALAWIIAAQALLLVPHLARVPLWVIAVYLFAFAWRVQAYRGRAELPGRWLKVLLSGAAAGGIVLSFGSLLGMEPMVAFLLTAFALKLTEMRTRKDAYVVVFLGYFVLLTAFLFTQALALVVYGVLIVWVLTTALVCVHRTQVRLSDPRPMKLAAGMLLQAVPLMLVLFFLFPRIGPLWSVPLKSHTAKTGMSDTLRPGDVSRLSQSDEVAFRVRFDGEIPAFPDMYWRGVVMSRLDGDTWRSLRGFEMPGRERREPPVRVRGEPIDYSVIMAPTQQNWLYALRYARPQRAGILALPDFRLYSPAAIEYETQYRVRSWPDSILEVELSDWRRGVETGLPQGDNPRTRELARELFADAASPRAFVDAALAYFRREPFYYTPQPPVLGDADVMDRFLFDTRRGFCEHYAYAFAVMARSVGIPARVIGGYQGGEVNPLNRTVIVHQFDAHAWNEVWLEGEGWVRVDPTAAVAPQRILYGLETAVAEEGSFLLDSPLSPLRFRGVYWINRMRLQYDALTYRWQSWVTGFDGAAQFDLLREVLGEVSATRSVVLLLGVGAGTMAVSAIFLLRARRRPTRTPVQQEFVAYVEALKRRGVEVERGDTPRQVTERAVARWPEQAEVLRALGRAFSGAMYAPAGAARDDRKIVRGLRGLLKSWRRASRRTLR